MCLVGRCVLRLSCSIKVGNHLRKSVHKDIVNFPRKCGEREVCCTLSLCESARKVDGGEHSCDIAWLQLLIIRIQTAPSNQLGVESFVVDENLHGISAPGLSLWIIHKNDISACSKLLTDSIHHLSQLCLSFPVIGGRNVGWLNHQNVRCELMDSLPELRS